MAVVSTKYLPNKASGDGAFRESHNLTETWLVRVDAPPPTTSVAAILTAPGVAYGAAHPSFASCKAMRWSYSAADGSGLLWSVSVQFFVPIVDVDPITGLPMDVWSIRGTTQSLPFFKDKNGDILKNSAGDPLEGMEREVNFLGWTLVRSYASLGAALSQMKLVNNKTNSDTWPTISAYGLADTWKCSVSSATKKVVITQSGATQTATRYWEVSYDIEYREDTWHVRPWDMGFSERCDASGVPTGTGTNRRSIKGADGKPVRQPVALAGGVALPPGTPPVALDFDPYTKAVFGTQFGEPS
jgi:hypothetical protein